MAKVLFTQVAEADLSELPAPVRNRAMRLIESVVTEFPYSGTVVLLDGEPLRMLPISPYPYIVLYATEGDAIWIIRLLHGMANWKK